MISFFIDEFDVETSSVYAAGHAACRHRFAARRSPAADRTALQAVRPAAWIARTMIHGSSRPAAAACDWPAVEFRGGHNRADARRSGRSDPQFAPNGKGAGRG